MTNGFGERLRALRMEHYLTMEKFSEMMDISVGFLGLVERGKRMFSLSHMIEVSKIFSVSLDFLIFGTEDKLSIDDNSDLHVDGEKNFLTVMTLLYKRFEPEERKFIVEFMTRLEKLLEIKQRD